MKNMHILPWDDSLCRKGQKTAWLRPYTLDWNNPESDSLHLEYSYNGSDWYQLNGNNGIWFPDFGSKRLHSPSIYQLINGTYLIAASDAVYESSMHLVCTTDFIHYTGAVCTDRDYEFERSTRSHRSRPQTAPLKFRWKFSQNFKKIMENLSRCSCTRWRKSISPQNREKNRLFRKESLWSIQTVCRKSGKSAGICPKLIG